MNRWIHWAKLLVGFVLVGIIYHKINQRESIIRALREADWLNVLLCLLLLIPNLYLAYAKWHYLLRNRFPEVSGREAFGSLMFGYTLGLITPGRLGELGRGLYFRHRDRLVVTGLNILDKVVNQLIFVTLGCIALYSLIAERGGWVTRNIGTILYFGIFFISLLWLIILNPLQTRRVLQAITRRIKPSSRIHSLVSAYENFTLRDILVISFLSSIWIMVIALQYHVLVTAFTSVSLVDSLHAVTATLFVKTLLPVTLGDLGIREGVAVFFYSQFHVSQGAVFNASLLIFLINFLIPAMSGMYYMFPLKELQNGKVEPDGEEALTREYTAPVMQTKLSDD